MNPEPPPIADPHSAPASEQTGEASSSRLADSGWRFLFVAGGLLLFRFLTGFDVGNSVDLIISTSVGWVACVCLAKALLLVTYSRSRENTLS